MNKAMLIGNLTKDPETRMTQTGKKVVSFSIAVNDGKDQNGQNMVQYFNITAWDKLADIIEKYTKKGHKVFVGGRLKNETWDKPDGTKGYSFKITANEVELLTSKADAEKMQNSEQSVQQNNKPDNNKPNNELPEIDINSMDVQMPF